MIMENDRWMIDYDHHQGINEALLAKDKNQDWQSSSRLKRQATCQI